MPTIPTSVVKDVELFFFVGRGILANGRADPCACEEKWAMPQACATCLSPLFGSQKE